MQQIKKNMISSKRKSRRGDTIVEAVIAIAIYSIVAVLAIASMNSGLKSAQKNLESTMSRAAVDSQVDAIRYIYENYILARTKGGADASYYIALWNSIKNNHMIETDNADKKVENLVHGLDKSTTGTCSELLESDGYDEKTPFVINARALYSPDKISTQDVKNGKMAGAHFTSDVNDQAQAAKQVILPRTVGSANKVETTPLYPRLLYRPLNKSDENIYSSILIGSNEGGSEDKTPSREALRSEGIWVVATQGNSYDFYVRTCWNAAGEKSPSTFTTVVRLYKAD